MVSVPHNARFLKLDIEEFYMSGSHTDLVAQALRSLDAVTGNLKRGFQKVTQAVLSSQAIRLRDDSAGPFVWRVVRGSGMGLLCSSEISNTAFMHRVEKGWIDSLGVIKKFGLVFYGRYEDDIFVITTANDDDVSLFLRIINSRARFFSVKLESISTDSCDVLDVHFFKGERWRHSFKLDYKVYTKPTSHWQPLALSSGHHPSTHFAWPRAMISRYRHMSSHRSLADQDISVFLSSLSQRCGFNVCSHFHSSVLEPDSALRLHTRLSSSQDHDIVFPWVVIPYRPEWLKARLAKVLNTAAAKWFHRPQTIVVGWRLADKHLYLKLRGLNEQYQSLPHFEFFNPLDNR